MVTLCFILFFVGIIAGVEIQTSRQNFWGSLYPTTTITERIVGARNATIGEELYVLSTNNTLSGFTYCLPETIPIYYWNFTEYVSDGNLTGRHDVVVTTEYYPAAISLEITTYYYTTVNNTTGFHCYIGEVP